jgi:hypothetical protein
MKDRIELRRTEIIKEAERCKKMNGRHSKIQDELNKRQRRKRKSNRNV